MSEFLGAAWPWIVVGLGVIFFAVYLKSKDEVE